MTERISDGIIRRKDVRQLIAPAGVVLAAVALVAFAAGCAERGNPTDDGGEVSYRVAATLPVEGYAEGVDVEDGLGLVAAGEGGLIVIDLADPESPAWLGTAPNSYTSRRCAYLASQSMGLVTDGQNGVAAFDLSAPTNPTWGAYLQGTNAQDLVATDQILPGMVHVFYADRQSGFRIWEIDLSWGPPWFPNQVYHEYTEGYAYGVCLEGGLAMVAAGQVGLWLYDVSSIYGVVARGWVDTPGNALAVAASGSYAYVADGLAGLQVIDVSDPDHPVIAGSAPTEDYASDVCFLDDRAYVADQDGGLRVFDVADPTAPREIGHLETPYANGVDIDGPYVYIADRDWGLVVITEE